MSEKITLLYLKATGHVLAAVKRTAAPESEIDAAALVGEALLIRFDKPSTPANTGGEQFEIVNSELAAAIVDFDIRLLVTPRDYQMTKDREDVISAPSASVSSITLMQSSITVTLTASVTEASKVWVQINGGDLDKPRTPTGTVIPINVNTGQIQVENLTIGTKYFVLVLVEGHQLYVERKTVT